MAQELSPKQSKLVFIIVGIIFTLIGFFMIKADIDTKNRMDSQTYSTDVTYKTHTSRSDGKTKTMYSPIYHYSVNGQNYECKTNFSSNTKPSKKSVVVKYMANNPSDCFVNIAGKNFLNWLFLILGLVAVFAGCKAKEENINLS